MKIFRAAVRHDLFRGWNKQITLTAHAKTDRLIFQAAVCILALMQNSGDPSIPMSVLLQRLGGDTDAQGLFN